MNPNDLSSALASLQLVVTLGGDILGAVQSCIESLEAIESSMSAVEDSADSGDNDAATGSGGKSRSGTTGGETKGLFAGLKEQFSGIGDIISSRMVATLAPVALIASAIAAETSGLGVFFSTVKLLTMVIGTALMPFFVILGAVVLALTGYLTDSLLPGLTDYYALIMGTAVEAIDALAKGFNVAAEMLAPVIKTICDYFRQVSEALADFAVYLYEKFGLGADPEETQRGKDLDDKKKKMDDARKRGDTKALYDIANGGKSKWYKDHVAEQIRKEKEAKAAGVVGGVMGVTGAAPPAKAMPQSEVATPPDKTATPEKPAGKLPTAKVPAGKTPEVAAPKVGGFRQVLLDSIGVMVRELEMAGPKAQSSGIADAAKRAQMAALNQSPIEAEMLKVMQAQLVAMRQAVDQLGGIKDKSGMAP